MQFWNRVYIWRTLRRSRICIKQEIGDVIGEAKVLVKITPNYAGLSRVRLYDVVRATTLLTACYIVPKYDGASPASRNVTL